MSSNNENNNYNFTPELILEQYKILYNNINDNNNNNKKFANDYLNSFLKSEDFILKSSYLLNQNFNDSNFCQFLVISIKNHIINNISYYKNDQIIYDKLKNDLLNIFFSLNIYINNKEILIHICSSYALLILIGIEKFWPNSIENIISMNDFNNNDSENKLKFSLLTLSEIETYLNEKYFSKKEINNFLLIFENKKFILYDFFLIVFNKISHSKFDLIFFNYFINFLLIFPIFKINLIEINELCDFLFDNLINIKNENEINNFCDVFNNIFYYSNSSNYKEKNSFSKFNKDFNKFFNNKFKSNEQNFIFETLNKINNFYIFYKNKNYNEILNNNNDFNLIYAASNIFSNLLNNFIYLLFLSNENINNGEKISNTLKEIFIFFLKCPLLKISTLLFECISTFKDFIDFGYEFKSNKNEFLLFINNLNSAIYNNTKLDNKIFLNSQCFNLLNNNNNFINYITKQNENLLNNTNIFMIISNVLDNEINNDEIVKYRKDSLDIYNDLFTLYDYYFSIKDYLSNLFLTLQNSIKNKNFSEIDAIFLNLNAIMNLFSTNNEFHNDILNILNYLFILYEKNEDVLNNQRILLNFILLINNINVYIYKNYECYLKCIKFLINLNFSLDKINILFLDVSNYLITNIISSFFNKIMYLKNEFTLSNSINLKENMKIENENIFINLNDYFFKKLNILNYNSIENLIKSMLFSIFINFEINLLNEENKINLTSKFTFEIINKINELIINKLNNTNETFKIEIIKIFKIYGAIFYSIGIYNKEIFYKIILLDFNYNNEKTNFFNIFYDFSQKIINIFFNDLNILNIIINSYLKLCFALQNYCENFFDKINEIIFNIYNKEKSCFKCVDLMNCFYCKILDSDSEKKQILIEKSFEIINNIFFNIKNINKNVNENIKSFCSLLNNFINKIPNFYDFFDNNNNYVNEKIFNDIFIYFNSILKEKNIEKDLNLKIIKFYVSFYKTKFLLEFKKFHIKNLTKILFNNIKLDLIKDYVQLLNILFQINKNDFNDVLNEIYANFDKNLPEILSNYFENNKFEYDLLLNDNNIKDKQKNLEKILIDLFNALNANNMKEKINQLIIEYSIKK